MSKWETIKLVDVCDIQYGYPFDSKLFSDKDGMPLIRIRDVVRGYSETYTTESYKEEYVVKNGDMLVGMDGEFNIAKWGNTPALLNQRVCRIIPKDNVDKDYIYYTMPKALKEIENRTPFVTVKHLSAKEINKIEIPLPPLEEQKQIADTLDKVTHTIDTCNAILEKLDLFVKSRFIELFGDPVTNPRNYNKRELNDICNKITDGTHDTPKRYDSGYLLITGKNIRANEIILEQIEYVCEEDHKTIYARCNPEYEDILYTNIGVNYGTAVLNTLQYEFSMKNVALLKPNKTIVNSIFLWKVLNYMRDYILKINQVGGAQTFMGLATIKKIWVPVPPLNLQQQFAAFVEQTDKSKFIVDNIKKIIRRVRMYDQL